MHSVGTSSCTLILASSALSCAAGYLRRSALHPNIICSPLVVVPAPFKVHVRFLWILIRSGAQNNSTTFSRIPGLLNCASFSCFGLMDLTLFTFFLPFFFIYERLRYKLAASKFIALALNPSLAENCVGCCRNPFPPPQSFFFSYASIMLLPLLQFLFDVRMALIDPLFRSQRFSHTFHSPV